MGVRPLADYHKKKGNLEPSLKDVITEGDFHAISPNTQWSEGVSWGGYKQGGFLRGWPSLTLVLYTACLLEW